jgi:titin
LADTGTSGTVVVGNLIGTDKSGTANLANGTGVFLSSAATANTVGGTAVGAGNVISANGVGIEIGGSITANTVAGNLIGTDHSGTLALGNGTGMQLDGSGDTIDQTTAPALNSIEANNVAIELSAGASTNQVLRLPIGTNSAGTAGLSLPNGTGMLVLGHNNTVGGTVYAGNANVFSGNSGTGVEIRGGGATGNLVQFNFIGTDITGTLALGNGQDGVLLDMAATNNTIGGGNIISRNAVDGVKLSGSGTSGNVVLGNLIGTDLSGTAKLGNSGDGVIIENSATANTVGGTASGDANVISGNGRFGVSLYGNGTSGNLVLGNRIGTDKTGTASVGNFLDGLRITTGATANTIGGTASGAANVISGNARLGLYLYGNGTSGNVVLGNLIGTNVSGNGKLPNNSGVLVGIGTANTIGGNVAGAANVISGNRNHGLELLSGTSANLVVGNLIGTDVTGTAALGNGGFGIAVEDATANTVGGTAAGDANVVSANQFGIVMSGFGGGSSRVPTANVVLGNLIGTDKSGTRALGNVDKGLVLQSGATANTVGGTAAGAANIVSANGGGGVEIASQGTSENEILGNLIGTDKSGTVALGNHGDGVFLHLGATLNTVGGTTGGAANVISGNRGVGVYLRDQRTSDNVVLGNLIGTDATFTRNLGNGSDGVLIDVGATSNTIGGTAAGSGNRISFNARGVVLGSSAFDTQTIHDSILENSIFSNSSIGIDLGRDGPTPNGNNPRAFANDGQNSPVLSAVSKTGASGTLTSTPRTNFRLEFFATPLSGGREQGQVFVGFLNVTTSTAGKVTFKASFTTKVLPGEVVTATATNLTNGDTSEFTQTIPTTVTVTGNPTIQFSSNVQTVRLSAAVFSGATAISMGTVTFSIVGLPGSETVSVGNNGVATASFVVPPNTRGGKYTIVVRYRGLDPFTDGVGYGTLTVLQSDQDRGFGGPQRRWISF